MSGLLVGILCITRRGLQFRSLDSSTTTNYDQHHSMIEQRTISSHGYKDETKLGEKARQAKERLDQKLRRTKSKGEKVKDVEDGEGEYSSSLRKSSEMFGLKRNGIKTFSRVVNQWKGSEKEECTICLDQFKVGDNLMHLQCNHKFHSWCLVPWLENYAHCPCCRMKIV